MVLESMCQHAQHPLTPPSGILQFGLEQKSKANLGHHSQGTLEAAADGRVVFPGFFSCRQHILRQSRCSPPLQQWQGLPRSRQASVVPLEVT